MKKGQVFRSNKDYFKLVAVVGVEYELKKPGVEPKIGRYYIVNVQNTPDGWFYKESSPSRGIDRNDFKERYSKEDLAIARELADYLF